MCSAWQFRELVPVANVFIGVRWPRWTLSSQRPYRNSGFGAEVCILRHYIEVTYFFMAKRRPFRNVRLQTSCRVGTTNVKNRLFKRQVHLLLMLFIIDSSVQMGFLDYYGTKVIVLVFG